MKQIVWAIAATAVLAGSAHAADGHLEVNGLVVATTCQVAQNNKDIVVNLESVGASALAFAGAEVGKKPFSIHISGCGDQEKIGVVFEVAEGTPTAAGTLPNVAPASNRASNVEMALYDHGNGVNARMNLNSGGLITQVVQTSSGEATLGYAVGYYGTGVATAGMVKGLAKFSVVYQ